MKKQNENSFESMLARIDEITAKLENPETTVDEGIMLFEEGVKLSSLCKAKLDEAGGKITELKGELDNLQKSDFKADKN